MTKSTVTEMPIGKSRSGAWSPVVRKRQKPGGVPQLRKAACLLPLAAGLSGTFASEALAQKSGDKAGELQEIVVTAEKRSTNLQKTPISVTVLSGEDLQRAQINGLAEIKSRVPNFQMGDSGGFTQITVRGIGISNFSALAEGAVAVNLNEVYVSRPVAQGTSLYDISAIEVLRGPQGTLYGRNATAGAVNIITARPANELAGFGRLTVGNYGQLRLEAAIGGPVVEDRLRGAVRLLDAQDRRLPPMR